MTTDQSIEQEIQAKPYTNDCDGRACKGERCTSTDGFGHSRECIAEAGRIQGWPPTSEDFASAGPSAPPAELANPPHFLSTASQE